MPFNRGIIGKYANTSSRTGLVTAKEQFILAAGGFYPRFVPSDVTATISRLLSLLVKTDGSNGGDNTSIVDSSTNGHTITVNGDSQTSSFSPYDPDGYSYYFDGTDDYLSIAYNSSLDITQQSKATIEAWIYIPSTHNTNDSIFTNRPIGATSAGVDLRLTSSRTIQYYETGAGSIIGTIVIPYREWTHVAVVKTGGGVYIYINGILDNSTEIFSSGTAGSNPTFIGRTGGAGNQYINAYLRDVRVVTGVDVYIDAFTPPTEPLTAISGTKLLTCHLPYLADGSTNGLSITINGNPYADPFSPYRGIPFDADLHGGSVYFDGSGDYLSIADAAPLDLGNGSTDFTIEFWALADSAYNTSTSDYVFYSKYQNPGNGIIIRVWDGELVVNLSGDAFDIETGFYPQPGIWHHYALVCNSGTVTMYADGVSRGTYSSAIVGDSGTSTTIGCLYYSGVINPFKGYISDFRIVKGTAIYTAAFTPPTEPLTAVANTSLFIKGSESAIYDATGFNTVFLAGNATTSTTQTKYATSSIKLDGTGDYLYFKEDNFALGTDDFTIELWAYIESFTGPSSSSPIIIDFRTASTAHPLLYIPVGTSNLVWYYNNSAQITGTSCLTLNTWHHIAVSRISGLTKLFVDGTQVGSSYADTNNYGVGTNRPYVGKNGANVNGELQGYIEDLRITQGLGRYPFIPEKKTLTAVSGTSLLTAHASSITDGSSNSYTVTAAGDAAVSTFAPKQGMYSVSLDGTGDYLSADKTIGHFGTNDFTIEGWWYFNTISAGYQPMITLGQDADQRGWVLITETDNELSFYMSNGSAWSYNIASTTVPNLNAWNHIAVTRNSGTLTLFLNGTSIGTASIGSNSTHATTSGALYIGHYPFFPGGARSFNGYISNLRIIEGTALYSSSFTPPTAALT